MTSIDPAYKWVEYDTHGMTDECPQYELYVVGELNRTWISFEVCAKCPHFVNHKGFIVVCKYPGYLANKEKEENNANRGTTKSMEPRGNMD